jgi:polysaccharide biosynthesis/export protein
MSQKTTIIVLFILAALSSCVPHRKMVYLQEKGLGKDTLEYVRPEYHIKTGDILHVRVLTLDEASFLTFNNIEGRGGTSYSSRENQISVYLHGYSVNHLGEISLPIIGNVVVAGLTTEQAKQKIHEMIKEYLIGATVIVKIANFSVTILGEVKRPGNYYIYDNRFTIMDIIGQAGDLTEFGNRKINVVRQTEDGAVFSVIDITDRNAVTSEFYYLQPDDLVYVQPYKVKRLGFREFPFSVLFSAVTTVILLLSFIK